MEKQPNGLKSEGLINKGVMLRSGGSNENTDEVRGDGHGEREKKRALPQYQKGLVLGLL